MITLEISNGIKFKAPESRSEITYQQWSKAYPYIKQVYEAQELIDGSDYLKATSMTIDAICGMISELSIGVKKEDLLNCDWSKVNKIFASVFSFIQNEPPKTEFKVNGKNLKVPDFNITTGLQLMDATAYLQQIKENSDEEKGLVIATIYSSEKYTQDLQEYEKRKEWLKKYAKMDLFYSCAFFLRNSIKILKLSTLPPLVETEVEKLTKDIVGLATTQYLLLSQRT